MNRRKERLGFKCRSFCLPTEERMEVTSVFLVARNFRRGYTLRRQTVFDWKFRVPCFYVEVAFADALWTRRFLRYPRDSRMFSCCRFSLQTRRGGLVKIYDSTLMSGVSYAHFINILHAFFRNLLSPVLREMPQLLRLFIFIFIPFHFILR